MLNSIPDARTLFVGTLLRFRKRFSGLTFGVNAASVAFIFLPGLGTLCTDKSSRPKPL